MGWVDSLYNGVTGMKGRVVEPGGWFASPFQGMDRLF